MEMKIGVIDMEDDKVADIELIQVAPPDGEI